MSYEDYKLDSYDMQVLKKNGATEQDMKDVQEHLNNSYTRITDILFDCAEEIKEANKQNKEEAENIPFLKDNDLDEYFGMQFEDLYDFILSASLSNQKIFDYLAYEVAGHYKNYV